MEKLQFENEQFILYSPDSLKYITDNMQNILAKSFKYYKILFDVDTFRKFQINYFDDIEVNVPNQPETYCEIEYGDWRRIPPENERWKHFINEIRFS